jgi:hypothetical protein
MCVSPVLLKPSRDDVDRYDRIDVDWISREIQSERNRQFCSALQERPGLETPACRVADLSLTLGLHAG